MSIQEQEADNTKEKEGRKQNDVIWHGVEQWTAGIHVYVPMLGPVLFDFCANLNCGKFMNVSS